MLYITFALSLLLVFTTTMMLVQTVRWRKSERRVAMLEERMLWGDADLDHIIQGIGFALCEAGRHTWEAFNPTGYHSCEVCGVNETQLDAWK